MKKPSASGRDDARARRPARGRARARAAPRATRARRRRARAAAPASASVDGPLAGRDRDHERDERAAGGERRDDAHRPERRAPCRTPRARAPPPSPARRPSASERLSSPPPRAANTASSATKPAACETTVTDERRQPARDEPAREVGDAPGGGGGEREQDGGDRHRAQLRTGANIPRRMEPLRIGVLRAPGELPRARGDAAPARRGRRRGAQARAARRPRRARHSRRRVDDVHAPDARCTASTRRSATSPGAVFGTCAGMIVLDRDHLGLVDVAGAAQRLRPAGRLVRDRPRGRGRERAAARRLHPGAVDRGRRPRRRGARRGRRAPGARARGPLPRRVVPSGADRRHAAPRTVPRGGELLSGHSKWSSIKHKKGAADAKRGKLFTKLTRSIIVAAKEGGGDPSGNSSLQNAIEKAKSYSMPKDNIDRAIAKGAGAGADSDNFEAIVYEGYGPEGVAVIVEALTDNRNRTAAEVRHAFTQPRRLARHDRRGRLAVRPPRRGRRQRPRESTRTSSSWPRSTAGAEDIEQDGGVFQVTSAPESLSAVRGRDRGGGLHRRVGRAVAAPEDDRRDRGRVEGEAADAPDRRARGQRRRPGRLRELRHPGSGARSRRFVSAKLRA